MHTWPGGKSPMESILAMHFGGLKLEEAEPQIPEEFVGQTNKTQQKWKAINSQEVNEAENEEQEWPEIENGAAFPIFRYLRPEAADGKH